MLQEILKERDLPELLSRDEMLEILQNEIYGRMPKKPEQLEFKVEENIISNFCAGKAVCNKVTAECVIEGKKFCFPFYTTLPTDGKKHPFFVHINFRPDIPDRYQPTEELIDNGFAVLSFDYNDVTKDNEDFTDGLAGVLFENGKREQNAPGKIAMWSWAAQRVMDYAETLEDVLELDCAVVCGHSRLGKTALLTAAWDERFAFGYSNDSGCSGAAITRNKQGETVEKICNRFGYWFCENYKQYMNKEETLPFDQHYLVASVAPRKVLVGSASEDLWADPISEFLCCVAASPAFEKGFQHENRLPEIGDKFFEGDIGYHLRKGLHYIGREDWARLIQFVNKHKEVKF